MQTTQRIPAKTASAKKDGSRKGAPDAVALLKADHTEVKKCFQAYDKLVKAEAGAGERKAMAEKICMMLTVHATIEDEIRRRNKTRPLPYENQLPSLIPNSISI